MQRSLLLALSALAISGAAWATKPTPAKQLPSGVTVTFDSGVPAASAKKPTAASVVQVHYRGTLANGQEFDSSYSRGKPAVFPLSGVIPCWTQGMQELTIGSKATLTCPANTAYGSRGIPNVIPPDAQLTFQVELLAIQP